MYRFSPTWIVAALVIFGSVAQAQVIIGNYPPANDSATTASLTNLRWKALSFNMPAATTADVGDLTVRLGDYITATDTPIVEIRDSAGTVPGPNILLSFNAPPPGGAGIQDYTYTPAALFTLQGGTSYWLLMRGESGGSADWRGSSPGIIPTGIATYGGQSLFSTNGGTSWANSATINSFQLLVIPEPSTLGLGAVGLLAGLARRRR